MKEKSDKSDWPKYPLYFELVMKVESKLCSALAVDYFGRSRSHRIMKPFVRD